MEVARIFRCEELHVRQMKPNPRDPRLWGRQTLLPDIPQFFVLPEAGWIFNGASTATAVPASAIPIKTSEPNLPSRWVRLVYQALVPAWAEATVPLRRGPPVPPQPTAVTQPPTEVPSSLQD